MNFDRFARASGMSTYELAERIKRGDGPRTEHDGKYVRIPIKELEPFKARCAAEARAEAEANARRRAAEQTHRDRLEAARLREQADALDPDFEPT